MSSEALAVVPRSISDFVTSCYKPDNDLIAFSAAHISSYVPNLIRTYGPGMIVEAAVSYLGPAGYLLAPVYVTSLIERVASYEFLTYPVTVVTLNYTTRLCRAGYGYCLNQATQLKNKISPPSISGCDYYPEKNIAYFEYSDGSYAGYTHDLQLKTSICYTKPIEFLGFVLDKVKSSPHELVVKVEGIGERKETIVLKKIRVKEEDAVIRGKKEIIVKKEPT